jgi:hypothetical protein
MVMNMQVATQALEAVAKTALETGHSAIGVSLHHGGADDLVVALDHQLATMGFAYVHVGDDSWVCIKEGSDLVLFALDCSNFDLTQHADATKEVHAALRRQLECIDQAAAGLWHAYARQRVVVVSGMATYTWRHAGPSGMPLQSKVNDMLMDVLINRVLAKRRSGEPSEWWDSTIKETGADLGFVIRVEQFARVRASSLREALEVNPFLFVGYYFSVRGGQVIVTADIPRTLAQMPYPSLKWMATGRELKVMEAMRLGSMVLSAGLPARGLEEAFSVWRDSVVALLDEVIRDFGDSAEPRLKWAVGESAFGPDLVPSLSGLRNALLRPPEKLWLEKEAPLPASSVWVPIEGASWADEVEGVEEAEIRAAGGWKPPAGAPLPAPRFARSMAPPTHGVSLKNHGRPGPTARWGPNKVGRETRTVRRGRALQDEEEWEDTVTDSYMDEEDDFYDEFSSEYSSEYWGE